MAYTDSLLVQTSTSVLLTVSVSQYVRRTSLIEWTFQVNRRRWTREHPMRVARLYSQSGRLIRHVNRIASSVVHARSSAQCKRLRSLSLSEIFVTLSDPIC